ncbi:MAG: elongation factor Ts, partial [Acidobacteria bacterium]|nr:elongation factor Ts [Acidobacteriota bacterium]
VEEEKRLIAAQAANEGKPEHIIDRIVNGKLVSFFADNVLYDQVFIKSEQFDGTVGDLVSQLAATMGENIGVVEVSRVAVGEGG